MTRNVCGAVTRLGQSLLLILWATLTAIAQSVSTHADWPTYGGDLSSTRYSPLDQIGAANFNKLEVAPRKRSGRGLAYWTDGRDARILYVTPGYRLVALDAKTGVRVPGFGDNGIVDLKQDDDQEMDLVTGDIGYHAAPVVARDVVIVGAAHTQGNTRKSMRNEKGYVRAFDVRTGKRLWIFHTIPSPGEFGSETWEKDSAAYTGDTG